MEYLPLRNAYDAALGDVLSDIESHIRPNHPYKASDKITWAHETTHGISSDLRQKFCKPEENAFYVLRNQAVVVSNPAVTIKETARLVPEDLRGKIYDLYLVKQAGDWNNTPTYLFDELVAYSNGSECALDLSSKRLYNERRSDSFEFMLEMLAYCTAMCCKATNDTTTALLAYCWNRAIYLIEQSKQFTNLSDPIHDDYLNRFDTHQELAAFKNSILSMGDYGSNTYL